MSTFSTYDSAINSIYLAFYGRPADPSGLKFWSKALVDNNGDAGTIIQAFATSQEAQTRFGSDTASARITDIYQQLFNRAPDAAGLAFWTNAVEQGSATLAEVSLAILKGAQSSDLDLSTLRQQAANAFTAAVEDGSTEYTGYASIEAARVLVRAVTADTTQADLANLVKAAVSFADTATRNPKVVEAIATGSTLLNLFDTARGTKDPVGLTQALADTAKAAAGDPVTLESLLRGGGMDKVLKVMPAKATLTDVVDALAKGGLPAAVEVVYPPKPAPSAPMTLKYESVSQGVFDTNKHDNVTNVEVATVKFSYTGSDLKAGQTFQYSIDGVKWTSDGVSANAATNIVTIKGVNLTGQSLVQPDSASSASSTGVTIQGELIPVANVFTTVQLRAVDAAKNVIAKADGMIEYDGTPPSGFIQYVGGTGGGSCSLPESVDTFAKFAVLDHDIIQWHIEGNSDWIDVDQFEANGTFKLPGLDTTKGQTVEVRVIDAAGNVGSTIKQVFEGAPETTLPPVLPVPPVIPVMPVLSSNFIRAEYSFGYGAFSQVKLVAIPYDVIQATGAGNEAGFLDRDGVHLYDFNSLEQDKTKVDYTSGSGFAMGANKFMQFDGHLATGVYQLAWDANAIAITNGTLNAGSFIFAGGTDGSIVQEGFTVKEAVALSNRTGYDSSDTTTSRLYVGDAAGMYRVTSGSGHDVFVDHGGLLMVEYKEIPNANASDLIIGFDSRNDLVSFSGDAAMAIDFNRDNDINWAKGALNVKTKVGMANEGAELYIGGKFLTRDLSNPGSDTLKALNDAIDLSDVIGVKQENGDHLDMLLLAHDTAGTGGALLYFNNLNDDGKIDAGEVTLIGVFTDGMAATGDIRVYTLPD